MTRSLGAVLVLVSYIGAPGCFADPTQLQADSEGGSEDPGTNGSEGPSTGAPTTTTSMPSTTAPDGSGSGSEDVPPGCGDGMVEGDEVCDDGNTDDGDGCESDCQPSPGSAIWTVVEDSDAYLGAYTVAVTPSGEIVAAGATTVGEGNATWIARYDGDGGKLWDATGGAGGWNDVFRGLALTDDERVIASGTHRAEGMLDVGYFEIYTADGEAGGAQELQLGATSYLIGAELGSGGRLLAFGGVDDGEQHPLLASYVPVAGGWQYELSTEDTMDFEGQPGLAFDAAQLSDGRWIAVGFTFTGASSTRAAAWLVQPDGSQPELYELGDNGNDQFIDVVIEDDVVHVVGRQATGDDDGEVWLAELELDDTLTLGWEATWADKSFNIANALAVADGVRFVAASTNDGTEMEGLDTRVLRWDGHGAEPTWVSPFAADAPGRDYAGDVAVAPDGTVVVVGVVASPDGGEDTAWVRKLVP